ncbi:hypothetical protein TNCV_4018261 [Trichonephila clavipes]|nr:hypothetical protein TNCV_4018261 [Trichonephila clavipes]
MDPVIVNHIQVIWMTPELAPPLQASTPRQKEDKVGSLIRYHVHQPFYKAGLKQHKARTHHTLASSPSS